MGNLTGPADLSSDPRIDSTSLCFFHLVHPACPVGPKDRTGVNPVK